MNRHILNKNTLLKKIMMLLLSSILSIPSFAFIVENGNSMGGEDDFAFIVIAKMGQGEHIISDNQCLRNIGEVYGQMLLSSDLPYGTAIKATQNVEQSGLKKRLCMWVKYGTAQSSVAFDDDPACKLSFSFNRFPSVGIFFSVGSEPQCNAVYNLPQIKKD